MTHSSSTDRLIPARSYTARLIDIRPKDFGDPKINPSYMWVFEITKGKYKGRRPRGLTPTRFYPRDWEEYLNRSKRYADPFKRLTYFVDGLLGREVTWDRSGPYGVSKTVPLQKLIARFLGTECRIRIRQDKKDKSKAGYYAVVDIAQMEDSRPSGGHPVSPDGLTDNSVCQKDNSNNTV